jgi:hypothetical protein
MFDKDVVHCFGSHPFDSAKWGRIRDFLVNEGVLEGSRIVEPAEASKEDLLVVHSNLLSLLLLSSSNIIFELLHGLILNQN